MSIHREAWVRIIAGDVELNRALSNYRFVPSETSFIELVQAYSRAGKSLPYDRQVKLSILNMEKERPGSFYDLMNQTYGDDFRGFRLTGDLAAAMKWHGNLERYPDTALPQVQYSIEDRRKFYYLGDEDNEGYYANEEEMLDSGAVNLRDFLQKLENLGLKDVPSYSGLFAKDLDIPESVDEDEERNLVDHEIVAIVFPPVSNMYQMHPLDVTKIYRDQR